MVEAGAQTTQVTNNQSSLESPKSGLVVYQYSSTKREPIQDQELLDALLSKPVIASVLSFISREGPNEAREKK